ncbi:MAG TPA: CopD family protein [Acetobacteraceae bacterium]|nr:CopD family protein [Acetobacteraceae bacterium]
MGLLVGLFGYLGIILNGLGLIAQSAALGGVLFLVLLARPFASALGDSAPEGVGALVRRDSARIAGWAALVLIVCQAGSVALSGAVLAAEVHLSVPAVLSAPFALSGLVQIAAALALAVLLAAGRTPSALLVALVAVDLAAATFTTHGASRLSGRALLMGAEGLHQFGAAIWIGGLPCFVAALARCRDGAAFRRVGARFSRMSMAGVGCILLSGIAMSVVFVGSLQGFYGTAYGVMVAAKIVMFLALLALGFMNFRLVERLRRDPDVSVNRLKRFAEVEIVVGIGVILAAVSLTSAPPAADLRGQQVSWAAIVARNAPVWPRLASPARDTLALPALQAKLDAQAAGKADPPAAFIPGSDAVAPRNAADIAWSEYNHHWAGIFVALIGLLALLGQGGARWARHWPLVFLGLAAFLFFRSDPEAWPLGQIGFLASMRDIEVLQHRFFVLLIAAFALFEWRVRAGALGAGRAALVFPILTAAGGALLLTHSHAIANIQDQMLIELTHTPIALLGIAAGCARWLELRLDRPSSRAAGWVWPVCFALVGLLLLNYREA